jgi:negative regulator of flagellin synthesis FlgM
MVDSIGPKGSTPNARIAPVLGAAAAAKIASAIATPDAQARAGSPVGHLAQELASKAPVDVDRIDRLRRAIAENNYPVDPDAVADRLIALKGEWHDAA